MVIEEIEFNYYQRDVALIRNIKCWFLKRKSSCIYQQTLWEVFSFPANMLIFEEAISRLTIAFKSGKSKFIRLSLTLIFHHPEGITKLY